MKFMRMGKLTLALPAFLVAMAGVVLSLAVVLLKPSVTTFTAALVLAASFFVFAYNINCTIVGKCVAWAWVLSVLYLLQVLLLLGGWFMNGKLAVKM